MKIEKITPCLQYKSPRDCYSSYFYKVDEEVNIIDKFTLHGKDFIKYLDGGSAYHCNLENYPTKEGFKKLLTVSSKEGCNYFCFNVKITCCEECGYINKQTLFHCTTCGSRNISHAVRIIGYLQKIKSFSTERQTEEATRFYAKV